MSFPAYDPYTGRKGKVLLPGGLLRNLIQIRESFFFTAHRMLVDLKHIVEDPRKSGKLAAIAVAAVLCLGAAQDLDYGHDLLVRAADLNGSVKVVILRDIGRGKKADSILGNIEHLDLCIQILYDIIILLKNF